MTIRPPLGETSTGNRRRYEPSITNFPQLQHTFNSLEFLYDAQKTTWPESDAKHIGWI